MLFQTQTWNSLIFLLIYTLQLPFHFLLFAEASFVNEEQERGKQEWNVVM